MLLKRSTAMAASVFALVGTIAFMPTEPVQAQAKKSSPKCETRIEGTGTGQGIAGAGTKKARTAAIADFQQTASTRFGVRYGNFQKAKGAKWDCRSGTLEAKCVVTAQPCR